MAVVRENSYKPLMRLEQGYHEAESDDAELEGSRCGAVGRTKRVTAAAVAIIGVVALVSVVMSKTPQGPLWASVQASTQLVNGTCAKPSDFCKGSGAKLSYTDCDDDGILDPYCEAGGYCGCVGSDNDCMLTTSPCLSGTDICERPDDFCVGDSFIYSERDCDGDGQPDPYCSRTFSTEGDLNCACLRSSDSCNEANEQCPDLSAEPMIELAMTDTEIPITSPVAGTLMYHKVSASSAVTTGEIVSAVVNAEGITEIKAPTDGIVQDVLILHPGQPVEAGERLIVMKEVLPTLAPLAGMAGRPVLAVGFRGEGKFGGWGGPRWQKGLYVPKGAKFASLSEPPLEFFMPEDGVLTGLSPLKAGSEVNDGAELGFYNPASLGINLPTGPEGPGFPLFGGSEVGGTGFDVLKNPSGAALTAWKVDVGDRIVKGDAVAEFSGPSFKERTSTYDGPTGIVFARQTVPVGQGLLEGADLISVGAGEFAGFKVKPGDVVAKGDPVAVVKIAPGCMIPTPGTPPPPKGPLKKGPLKKGPPKKGPPSKTRPSKGPPQKTLPEKSEDESALRLLKECTSHLVIPASKDGEVVAAAGYKVGDQLGFDIPLQDSSFVLLQKHLPTIPPPTNLNNSMEGEGVEADKSWLKFDHYTVAVGSVVFENDTVADAIEVNSDGTEGDEVNLTAGSDGIVYKLQNISRGDYVGPHDQLALIFSTVLGYPWWMWALLALLLLCCCCLLLLLLCCCCRKKKEEPEPVAAPPPPPPVEEPVEEPNPVVEEPPPPAPAPAPAPAPKPVAPKGIPVYFDHKPYYFEYQPIGIKFNETAPIKIHDFIFNSYGKTLGMQKGQTLTKINEVDVEADHQIKHVEGLLHDTLSPLPYWPLRVDFKTPTQEVKTYYFVEKPLGILFTEHLPIKVASFRPYSLAQKKGVCVGWEIIRIADEDTSVEGMKKIGITSNSSGYKHVDHHLIEGLNHLPAWKLRIDFKTGSGQAKTIEIGEKPFGMQITSKPPIAVDRVPVGTIADSKGVQPGWTITRIGDTMISPTDDHKKVDHELKEQMKHLPDRKR